MTDFFQQIICQCGPISFRDFMESALYHPEKGYYMVPREKIGTNGDFYTSSCLGPVFGAMIGKQLAEMRQHCGVEEFTVVEFGAGNGQLCLDILNYFREHTGFYDRLRYVIIEKSPFMREKEHALLKSKVCWAENLDAVGPFTGCVLSNELLDNFAVHKVMMKDQLMEVFVTDREGLTEILQPAGFELINYFKELGVELPDGYCTEVNLQAREWLAEINRYLIKGFVLTIDYGYLSEELYHTRRSAGTLLCYHRHQLCDKYLEQPGNKDITAHVNFSALMRWGEQLGLHTCGLTTQAAFLLALDFKSYLRQQATGSENVLQLAMQESRLTRTLLIDMGSKFKVLVQRKNIDDITLSGLRLINLKEVGEAYITAR